MNKNCFVVVVSSFRYIQFKDNESDLTKSKGPLFWRGLASILSYFIPKGNPDFEALISEVKEWLVELNEEGVPEREVGINQNGVPIMKMPWKKNYGFWTDSNLKRGDFENLFQPEEIEASVFEDYWNTYGGLGFHQMKLSNFMIKRTGADGGHSYLSTKIERNRRKFPLTVYFLAKKDERQLDQGKTLVVQGVLFNNGDNSFSLLNSVIVAD